jgi:hypothetical protein
MRGTQCMQPQQGSIGRRLLIAGDEERAVQNIVWHLATLDAADRLCVGAAACGFQNVDPTNWSSSETLEFR